MKETEPVDKLTPEEVEKAKAKAEALEKASNINKATVSTTDIKKASDLGATSITLGTKVKKSKRMLSRELISKQ